MHLPWIAHSWMKVPCDPIPTQRAVSVGARIGVYRNKGEGMPRFQARIALLIGALAAVAVSPARAQDAAPCGPKTRTITITECVPETYQTKRIAYKVECRTEMVDGVKCVCVPEVRENVYTVIKKVPVTTMEVRKVCCNVTEYQDRVVTKSCTKYVQETKMCKKLVALGRWECREVCRAGILDKLLKGCCDPCDPCCNQPRTRKVWVPCPVYKECPVTVCKKICVQEPMTVKVAVCKQITKEVPVQVCRIQCVEEKKVDKCTVYVQKQVPCKVARTLRVCVPYEETVTCTRMVQRTRDIVVQDGCCPPPRCGLFGKSRQGDCCR